MTLFSKSELEAVSSVLISGSQSKPETVLASAALSHLCEPGDTFMGRLFEKMGSLALLAALVERLDEAGMGERLGQDFVQELEDAYEQQFSQLWTNATERWCPRLSKNQAIESVDQIAALGGKLVGWNCEEYPQGLNDLDAGKPPVIWLLGNPELLADVPRVSVVGTRSSNRYGTSVAADISAVAVQNRIVTVSGGAIGIDAVVHQSTLALEGDTIAVMAGGLGKLYPSSNLQLLRRIAQTGLLVAEQPPAVSVSKWRFLMRNRLIAALGDATVVVQAGRTSGALSTAKHALSIHRPVAMVPGPIDSAFSVGCHDFLNANLEHDVQLLARPQALPSLLGMGSEQIIATAGLGALEKRALDAFSDQGMQAWEVQRLAGLTVKETQIALGSLVLSGHVEREGTHYVKLTK